MKFLLLLPLLVSCATSSDKVADTGCASQFKVSYVHSCEGQDCNVALREGGFAKVNGKVKSGDQVQVNEACSSIAH